MGSLFISNQNMVSILHNRGHVGIISSGNLWLLGLSASKFSKQLSH